MKENNQEIEFVLSDDSNIKNNPYKEAMEIIMWYHIFISVKLNRAISGYNDKEQDDVMEYDMNGSAKITLIAIERSIGAWGLLMQRFDHHEDEIFYFIKILKYLVSLL